MISYVRELPLISVHIPKTGGTSFRFNLKSWFGRRLFFHYQDELLDLKPPRFRLKGYVLPGFRRDLCIHGHFNMNIGLGIEEYYPEVTQFITWLRDPVELQISLFTHQMKHRGNALYKFEGAMGSTRDIDEFLERSRCPFFRSFPRPVNEQNLREQIDRWFIHIGVLERAEISLDTIACKLGKKIAAMPHENRVPRHVSPSESSIRRFKEKCSMEYKLYDLALTMNP